MKPGMQWLRACAAVCVLAATLAVASPASAADGDLDTSFSDDGLRTQNRTAGTDVLYDILFLDDGTFIGGGKDHNNLSKATAQRMANLGYNADGLGNGLYSNPNDRTFWSTITDAIQEVLLMSDGRVVFVGYAGTNTGGNGGDYDCVAKVHQADGDLDETGFNAANDSPGSNLANAKGRVFVRFSTGNDQCFAGALQADDKILVGGAVVNSDWDIALARINTDGTIDTSFGTDGRMTADLGGSDAIYGIEVQPDGNIVVAGKADGDFFVARYTTDGELDDTFSSDGIHQFDLGASNTDVLRGMQLQSDGKIVVAGYNGSGDWGLARLTTDGAMDTSFGGGDGITITDFGGSSDVATDLAIAADGKIFVGGYTDDTSDGSAFDMAVARYTTLGVLDTGFSGDGKATAGWDEDDRAHAIAITGTGSVLLGGASDAGTDSDWAFAQFLSSLATAGFTLSGTTASVTEAGSTDTFTVVLDAQPASDVVISVSSGDTDEATVSPSTLTFTSSNWDDTQTVTVTGINDNVDDGNQDTAVTMSVVDASSNDYFDSVSDQAVTVTTVDDDTAGFSLSKTTASVTEGGSTDTFTVVLDTQPLSDVVVAVSSADTSEATVSAPTLTFTSGSWNVPQSVTVTGVDDIIDDGDQDTTVTISVDDNNSDNAFDGLAHQTATATTTDNDDSASTPVTVGYSITIGYDDDLYAALVEAGDAFGDTSETFQRRAIAITDFYLGLLTSSADPMESAPDTNGPNTITSTYTAAEYDDWVTGTTTGFNVDETSGQYMASYLLVFLLTQVTG